MQLHGFHHVTAITAQASRNLQFYTQTLGLRLVKKTVNQDDVSAYHLFYADGAGTPGTDITFFDWEIARERRGVNSIARTGFRVPGEQSLDYWSKRLTEAGLKPSEISSTIGHPAVEFDDFEGQRLTLVSDPASASSGTPWERSPVPAEHQIRGLGPVTISVAKIEKTRGVLLELMAMQQTRQYTRPATDGSAGQSEVHVFQSAEPGPQAELHVAVEPTLSYARSGAGGVHHIAFRVPTFEEYDRWQARLDEFGMPSSGPVDRFYFRSLYFREPSGILFELATDQPGFAADEPAETLGEKLALPPFLEPRRKAIEAGLKPL